MSTLTRKQSADALADLAISTIDDLVTHIQQMNGNTHTVKEMISDIWAHRENTPFVVTVFEAIQEVKPPELSEIGQTSVES